MSRAENIYFLSKLTNCKDEELLSVLIDDAEAFALSYTGRTKMIDSLNGAVRDLALISFNRLGTEGEKSRSDGGESYSFEDSPKKIYDVLNRHRLARVGGVTHANQAKQTSDTKD